MEKEEKKFEVDIIIGAPSPYFTEFCELLGEKCSLRVLYQRKNYENRDKEWKKKENNKKYNVKYLKGVNIGNEIAFNPGIIKQLLKRKESVTVISDYYSPTAIIAMVCVKIIRKPIIIHIDGGIIAENENSIIKCIKKTIFSQTDYFLSSGKETDKYINYYSSNKAKIYHYPFTSIHKCDILDVPYNEEKKKQLRKDLRLPDSCVSSFLCVFVGSIIYRKGIDILLKAARKCDEDIHFLIIGGNPTSKMQEWIYSHSIINVHFINYVNSDKVKYYIRCADLFVFPTRYDIWGLVIIEALAGGIPVITTDKCVAGLELIKNGETGFIIPSENIKSLVKAINYYRKLRKTKKEYMMKNALEYVREYNLENMSEIYYSDLVNIKARG